MTLNKKAFENIVGNAENVGLLFPQCFLPFPKQFLSHISMGECNTILRAYTKYRFLG